MTHKAPQLTIYTPEGEEIRCVEDVTRYIKNKLHGLGWRDREGEFGWAMVHLFGRLTELTLTRLNRLPDKHFLAFLNEAGIDQLPPRPATVDITFLPPEDGPDFIRVPAGTQVATVQTETQPEVIFETERDFLTFPNTLVKCIAFDPLNYSDCTTQAIKPTTGQQTRNFAAFQGEKERERNLYLGDNKLFAFADAASRQAAKVTLHFTFTRPGDPDADDWELVWLYWNGSTWASLLPDNVEDHTKHFSRDGDIVLSHLPEFVETEVNGHPGLWLACKLTGGLTRHHIPILKNVTGSRVITIDNSTSRNADAAFSVIQSGTAFVPLDPTGEFFPLGQRPGRLDTFYLQADEAFTKQGARVKLSVNLIGVTGKPKNTSELDALTLEWEYYSSNGWTPLGTSHRAQATPQRLDFEDTTNAFTTTGDEQILFTVPGKAGSDPLFEKTKINGQSGYWIRARVVGGSYDILGGIQSSVTAREWIPPQTHAPLIKSLKISYHNYSPEGETARELERCCNRVDGMPGTHPLFPFCSKEEGPALYLGFQRPYPAERWVQILLDVSEGTEPWQEKPPISWEYWTGERWAVLRASDGSQSLSERGYLGFFAPSNHQPSTEFGQTAYWLRVRPPNTSLPPQAQLGLVTDGIIETNAPPNITLPPQEDQKTLTLKAMNTQAFDCKTIKQYTWRLISSTPLVADAGEDQILGSTDRKLTTTLDGSNSYTLDYDKIAHYIWRLVSPMQEESRKSKKKLPATLPYLNTIRLNTVPAHNAITINNELLGSSDGKPNQTFFLLRKPVLLGAQIAIREPDRPPDDELQQLQEELRESKTAAMALLPMTDDTSSTGPWVLWHSVTDFHSSTPSSRHFILDPIRGQVRFGDGKRGKIPPIGHNNIQAVCYRVHNGTQGNLQPGTITMLRNPSGDLANIKGVTNAESSAGGSEAETVSEVKKRGPQRLKHRQRAVTMEDFVWLTQEASGEIIQAWCLPARNPVGLSEPGWVTVVIIPASTEAKPMPSLGLLRRVEAHLKEHALANLKQVDHIHVTGPEYIEVTVFAWVRPSEPEKADEVELAVLERLEAFLHPLRGGAERSGWTLGRNVYLSEIYAEIEAVEGVDYVSHVRLKGSLQQRLHLNQFIKGSSQKRKAPFDLPVDSQVSTFDERIKLRLAEPISQSEDLVKIAIYGFKAGDSVAIVAADNSVLKDNLTIASLSDNSVMFTHPFEQPEAWTQTQSKGLISLSGHMRLPLSKLGIIRNKEQVVGVNVQSFEAGDKVSIVVGVRRDPNLEFLPVKMVESCEDRIVVPEGTLIYSGDHDINMILE